MNVRTLIEQPREPPKPKACTKCGGPLTVAHFYTACRNCDPFYFAPCGKCRVPRIQCSC